MKLSEQEFRQLTFLGTWEIESGSIIAGQNSMGYLLGRKVKGYEGMAYVPYDSDEALMEAFISAVRSKKAGNKPYTPDLFSSLDTLDEVQQRFREELDESGKAVCPCCGSIAIIHEKHIPPSSLSALATKVMGHVGTFCDKLLRKEKNDI